MYPKFCSHIFGQSIVREAQLNKKMSQNKKR